MMKTVQFLGDGKEDIFGGHTFVDGAKCMPCDLFLVLGYIFATSPFEAIFKYLLIFLVPGEIPVLRVEVGRGGLVCISDLVAE